jgi:uncharacterized oligopeptide transporter (OPT) family protein
MASVAKGMFGGVLPWSMVWIGVAIGATIIVIDQILKARGVRFRVPVLGAAVGIYLPLEYTVPIFLGGFLTYIVERIARVPDDPDAKEKLHRRGVLFAAGLITGEALMGIIIAFAIVASRHADVLALPEKLQPAQWGEALGVVVLGVIAWLLYRTAIKSGGRPNHNR